MTILKTALEKAINEWEDRKQTQETAKQETAKQEPPQTADTFFKTSNNISRVTFYAVANANPPKTRKQLTAELVAQGYKEKSVASILSQIIKNKLARLNEDGTVQALVKHYKPLKTTTTLRKQVVMVKKPKPVEAAPLPEPDQIKTALSTLEENQRISNEIDAWLDNASLTAACVMWTRLSRIFGAPK